MKVLVLNCGSSSVKYQLIETSLDAIEKNEDRMLARGSVERIGTASAVHTFQVPGRDKVTDSREILEHRDALTEIVRVLTHREIGVIADPKEVAR